MTSKKNSTLKDADAILIAEENSDSSKKKKNSNRKVAPKKETNRSINAKNNKKKNSQAIIKEAPKPNAVRPPSLTSFFKKGDLVWFFGTPHPRDKTKLLRVDKNSNTRFFAKVSLVLPGQFYCLSYADSGIPIKRPFQDQNIFYVSDCELLSDDIRFLRFYDSFNMSIDKLTTN